MTYDLEWNAHPEWSIFNDHYRHGNVLPKPKNFKKMLDIATTLSAEFPEMRVDLYNIDGSDEQNRQKEQPTNRQMEIKRAWGVSREQKP